MTDWDVLWLHPIFPKEVLVVSISLHTSLYPKYKMSLNSEKAICPNIADVSSLPFFSLEEKATKNNPTYSM